MTSSPSSWPFKLTRLAPSPTGALHLGHARTFLITWWLARQTGAKIILRMEDLDASRIRPESVPQTYDDLRWLGMDWDFGPPDAGAGANPIMLAGTQQSGEGGGGEYVQSHRLGFYAQALGQLWQKKAIYPCTCSRAQIAQVVAASGGAPHETDLQLRYPGICRSKPLAQVLREASTPAPAPYATPSPHLGTVGGGGGGCWRLKVPPGEIPFSDHILGPKSFNVDAEAGDFPITRFGPVAVPDPEARSGGGIQAGPPAYQLACVVDDAAMGIDAVIRGDDLLSSTSRQILLYRALGLEPPAFGHIPLVIGADGKRLAKRHGESRIAQFRAVGGRGVSAEKIVGWVAWRSGQIDSLREISARELLTRFDLARLPRERVVIRADDLHWLCP